MNGSQAWPELKGQEFHDTIATLQLWTQIVGKIRLVKTPWLNHSWQVTLYVTARGLTSSPIADGERTFQIDFDFIDQRLVVETSEGERVQLPLRAQSVADFHDDLMATLEQLGTSNVYAKLEAATKTLAEGLEAGLRSANLRGRVQRVGSMFTLFFNDGSPIRSFACSGTPSACTYHCG